MNLSDLEVTPRETELRLVLDGSLVARLERLRADLKSAKRRDLASGGGLSAEAPQIEQQLAEAERDADEKAVTFRFRAIGQGKFAQLVAQHPPTQDQWERFRERQKGVPFLSAPEFDPVGLSLVLIAASCVDPAGSESEWRNMRDEKLSDGQWAELYGAALKVNTEASVRPTYGTVTDETASSGPDSTTPPNTESLSPSSTDE